MIMQGLLAPRPELRSAHPPGGLSRLGAARRRLGSAP